MKRITFYDIDSKPIDTADKINPDDYYAPADFYAMSKPQGGIP
jgi:hypothetical protein